MKRILVFGMNENPGGVESFIMNYFREFNREKLVLDFLCNSNAKIAYEDELISKGARVFHVTARSKNPIRYYWEMYKFFKNYAASYYMIIIEAELKNGQPIFGLVLTKLQNGFTTKKPLKKLRLFQMLLIWMLLFFLLRQEKKFGLIIH